MQSVPNLINMTVIISTASVEETLTPLKGNRVTVTSLTSPSSYCCISSYLYFLRVLRMFTVNSEETQKEIYVYFSA